VQARGVLKKEQPARNLRQAVVRKLELNWSQLAMHRQLARLWRSAFADFLRSFERIIAFHGVLR
jgi:hypothetical protein